MKKLLLVLGVLSMTFGYAQQQDEATDNESAEEVIKKNIIKTNVTAFAFRNLNLSYERAISKRFSINLGFGTVPTGKVPFIDSFVDDGSDAEEIKNLEFGFSNFTIEPRVYLGKGYGKGFYLAPYFRHSNLKMEDYVYTFTYENSTLGISQDIPVTLSGSAKGNSGGLMLGAQFFLTKSKNLVLDWWIVGAHYGTSKGDFSGKTNMTMTPDMQAQLKEELEGFDIPLVDYTVETNPNGATAKLDGPWGGVRSGLSIGYRF